MTKDRGYRCFDRVRPFTSARGLNDANCPLSASVTNPTSVLLPSLSSADYRMALVRFIMAGKLDCLQRCGGRARVEWRALNTRQPLAQFKGA